MSKIWNDSFSRGVQSWIISCANEKWKFDIRCEDVLVEQSIDFKKHLLERSQMNAYMHFYRLYNDSAS